MDLKNRKGKGKSDFNAAIKGNEDIRNMRFHWMVRIFAKIDRILQNALV